MGLADYGFAPMNREEHRRLAEERPEGWSIGPLRAAVRDLLRAEWAEIDACAREVLGK